MSRTISLFTLHGIAVQARISAVVAFLLLLLVLVALYFPQVLPGEQAQTHWSVAFLSALALFSSIVVHELGHSLTAQARGLAVNSITLVRFGGSSDIGRENERALDELLVALAGPVVSLGLAGAAAVARFNLPIASQPLVLFLEVVLFMNLWLGAFNLLPSLPLDGGRAMRGLLWQWTGDHRRATRIASVLGRGIAAALFVGGVVLLVLSLEPGHAPWILGQPPPLVAVLAVLLAWFLNTGSRDAYRQLLLQERFRGVKVAEVMTPDPSAVTPWTSLNDIVGQYFLQKGERAVPVVRDGDVLMGLVTYHDVRKVPRAEWSSRAAGEVMTPVTELVTVSPGDPLETAIRPMAERHFNQLPVVQDGQLVGMIARVNILRFLDWKTDKDGGAQA